MAYVKQIWHDLPQTDTPISATKLNHIEDGIERVEHEIPQVLNTNSSSTTDTYSCNYINDAIRKSKNETLNTGTNIDNITSSGVYGIFNATGTLPSGYTSDNNNIFIQSMMWGSDWGRQVLYDVRSNATYTRNKLNGTWQSWVSLL